MGNDSINLLPKKFMPCDFIHTLGKKKVQWYVGIRHIQYSTEFLQNIFPQNLTVWYSSQQTFSRFPWISAKKIKIKIQENSD